MLYYYPREALEIDLNSPLRNSDQTLSAFECSVRGHIRPLQGPYSSRPFKGWSLTIVQRRWHEQYRVITPLLMGHFQEEKDAFVAIRT